MKTTKHNQASTQESRYPIDCTASLLTGVTVTAAVATHVAYPSGSPLSITTNVSSPIVYVNVPAGLVVGTNVIRVDITTSDSALSPVHVLEITTTL